jgi:hypothetical protein
MLGAVLKQHNGAPASRIRPQRLAASRHFLQSRISFSNSTFFSSKIQASTYKRHNVSKSSSSQAGKEEVERKLTSQQLASRLDNTKNEGLALFTMGNFSHQTGYLFFKGGDLLHIATGLASLFDSHLRLAFSQG